MLCKFQALSLKWAIENRILIVDWMLCTSFSGLNLWLAGSFCLVNSWIITYRFLMFGSLFNWSLYWGRFCIFILFLLFNNLFLLIIYLNRCSSMIYCCICCWFLFHWYLYFILIKLFHEILLNISIITSTCKRWMRTRITIRTSLTTFIYLIY